MLKPIDTKILLMSAQICLTRKLGDILKISRARLIKDHRAQTTLLTVQLYAYVLTLIKY